MVTGAGPVGRSGRRSCGDAGRVIGTRFMARVAHLESTGVVPEISGSAWITGTHQFVLADTDPLTEGFDLGL